MKKLFAASFVVLLFLVGCGSSSPEGNTGQLTGKLSVTISGLPNGVDANATVSGPNNFSKTLTQTTIINNLALGSYTVGAQDVTAPGTTYKASVSGSPVNVQADATNVASVSYSKVTSPPNKTNHPPTVSLSVVTASAKRGISATASASDPDGDNLTYTWNFGDGNTQVGGSVQTHSYTVSGTYTVKITVSDGHLSSSASKAVKVQYLRPADSPDVVIIGFAGRCGRPLPLPGGCSFLSNTNYLSSYKNFTLQTIANTFAQAGYSAQWWSYASIVDQSISQSGSPGYHNAQIRLDQIKNQWISDFDDPTSVVLVGHSHGTVWASLLAMENPDVYFPLFIYLDGVCNHWDLDNITGSNGNVIRDFYDRIGEPYPTTLAKYHTACNSYPVPGLPDQHLKDVVPWNVGIALEAQSDDTWVVLPDSINRQDLNWTVSDKHNNHRPDGSTGSAAGIYIKRFSGETHSDIPIARRAAMNWVVSAIRVLLSPSSQSISQPLSEANPFRPPP